MSVRLAGLLAAGALATACSGIHPTAAHLRPAAAADPATSAAAPTGGSPESSGIDAAPPDEPATPTDVAISTSNAQCNPSEDGSIITCDVDVAYGNISSAPVTVDATTTEVVDGNGNSYAPQTYGPPINNMLINPGFERTVSWSVTIPATQWATGVTWTDNTGAVATATTTFASPPADIGGGSDSGSGGGSSSGQDNNPGGGSGGIG